MKIGVLALQGAVAEHIKSVEAAGGETIAVRDTEQLNEIDGLIIPGGESTAIGKLMRKYGFIEAIKNFSANEKPIFGTCAGLIVLAKNIADQQETYLELMDMTVKRNALGRQRESFETYLSFEGIEGRLNAVFIRAPLITSVDHEVEILSIYNNEIVTVRQGHLLAASYHPELTDDLRLHEYFLNMVQERMSKSYSKRKEG